MTHLSRALIEHVLCFIAGLMVMHIIAQMTSLAHGLEIIIGTIFGLMIEVCHGQDDNAASNGMGLAVDCLAPDTVYFTLALAT